MDIKNELNELEELKKKRLEIMQKSSNGEKKGFFSKVGRFVQTRASTADIDRRIMMKQQFIRNEEKLKNIHQQIRLASQHERLIHSQEKLARLKKESIRNNSIQLEDFGGRLSPAKPITSKDIFG